MQPFSRKKLSIFCIFRFFFAVFPLPKRDSAENADAGTAYKTDIDTDASQQFPNESHVSFLSRSGFSPIRKLLDNIVPVYVALHHQHHQMVQIIGDFVL